MGFTITIPPPRHHHHTTTGTIAVCLLFRHRLDVGGGREGKVMTLVVSHIQDGSGNGANSGDDGGGGGESESNPPPTR